MRITAFAAASAAILLAASLGACSREDATQIKEGAQAAAGEVKQAATDIKNDPDVKEAGAAMKDAAKDAGAEIKSAARDAGDAAKDAGADLKAGAKDVASDADAGAKKAAAATKKAGKEVRDEVDGNPKTS
jgi:hypothetical protein